MFIYIYILRWEVWTHKTSLTPGVDSGAPKGSLTPQFVLIEESAPTQENVRSCICVLRAVMYLCVKGGHVFVC